MSATNSSLSPMSNATETPSAEGKVAEIAILCVILLSALITNCLICTVFYKRPHLLTVSNSFLLNLACCDVGLAVLVMPFMIVSASEQGWAFGAEWCQAQGYITTVLFSTSTVNLLLVSLDRYYYIIAPLRYPFVFTQTRGNIMLVWSWLVGLIVAIPPLFNWGEYRFQREALSCTLSWTNTTPSLNYLIFFSSFSYILPLIGMIWCYCSIFNVALGHTRRSNRVHPVPQSSYVSPRQPPDVLVPTVDRAEISDGVFGDAESQETTSSEVVSEPSRYSQSRDCKAARTILLIAVAFLTCWVPYFIVAGLQVYGNTVDDVVVTTATLLAHCSSVLNIVIYGYLNKYLRIEMFRLLKQMRQNRSHDSTAVVNIESEENASTTFTTLSSLKLAYMPRGGTPRPKMKAKRDAPLNSDIHAIEELAEDSKSSTRCLQIRVQCSDSAENTAPGPLGTGLNSSHGDTDLAVSPKPKCCVTWQDKTKNDVKTKGGLILTPHFYMDEESTANDGSYFDDVIAGNSSPAVSTGDLC